MRSFRSKADLEDRIGELMRAVRMMRELVCKPQTPFTNSPAIWKMIENDLIEIHKLELLLDDGGSNERH